jgi:hypothetical protein
MVKKKTPFKAYLEHGIGIRTIRRDSVGLYYVMRADNLYSSVASRVYVRLVPNKRWKNRKGKRFPVVRTTGKYKAIKPRKKIATMPRYKTFRGVRYELSTDYDFKDKSRGHAAVRRLRKIGFKARLVKGPDPYRRGKSRYYVYRVFPK